MRSRFAFPLMIALLVTSLPASAKIRTYYSNAEVLAHVLSSEALAEVAGGEDSPLVGAELEKTQTTREGEGTETTFEVRLGYKKPGLGAYGPKEVPCFVNAKVAIEIKTTDFGITVSRLTAPELSGPVCAM